MKLLDTCFLIELNRELKTGTVGNAQTFIEAHPDEPFAISVITVTEFLEGSAEPAFGEKLLRPFHWYDVGANTSRLAAKIRCDLGTRGQLIGDFDILIAATAKSADTPLVTNNVTHFGHLPDLIIESY
ncbi:MAG: type II toxin-antitoxin system VapC family toxin [Verrucomicrobiota bacterium]